MIKIAVRDLALFEASGSLSADFNRANNLEAMKAHLFIQNSYNENSKKEVKVQLDYHFHGYDFLISGIMDGLLNYDTKPVIEEIKSTNINLENIKEPTKLQHLTQLKIYAYIYMTNNNLSLIKGRLKYIRLSNYNVKTFNYTFKIEELETFFESIIQKYLDFEILTKKLSKQKMNSLKSLEFPFEEKRVGQQDLIEAVSYTIDKKEILYAQAATGIGKTISVLYSSLKAIDSPKKKIFYCSAKTSQKKAAVDAVKLFHDKNVSISAINITAKAKICPYTDVVCDKDKCDLSLKYYDNLGDAVTYALKNYQIIDFKELREIAEKFMVCPYEFSLDLSYYIDIIIADYNYVFDPIAHLIRYFEEDTYQSIVLIDEAHNLVDRSKQMYSASFNQIDLLVLNKKCVGLKPSVKPIIKKIQDLLENYDEIITEELPYSSVEYDFNLMDNLVILKKRLEEILGIEDLINKKEILEKYLIIKRFVDISLFYSNTHRFIIKKVNGLYEVKLTCLDSSSILLNIIKSAVYSCIFFSATLLPMNYYKKELTKEKGFDIMIESPFDKDNLLILVNDEISTKYKDRHKTIDQIAKIIKNLVSYKTGNYMVFFNSYQYMNQCLAVIKDNDFEIIIHEQSMNEIERLEILNTFEDYSKTKVLFTVLGGSYSEGIDLVGEKLSGVIIIGTGLPRICFENNMLKEYYNNQELSGFDYAYTYPGINKVIQAAGRVIRTKDDIGFVQFIDERYAYKNIKALLPNTLINFNQVYDEDDLKTVLENFYTRRKNNVN